MSLDFSIDINIGTKINAISRQRALNNSKFGSLLEDDTFKDFTFKVRDKEIKVHKNVLSVSSSVFKAMFTCGLDETRDNSASVECDPDIFEHFVKFIYTDKLPDDAMPAISRDLYEFAHRYEIIALIEICLEFILVEEINDANAVDIYEFASTYEIEELLDKSWKFIKQ